jgi:TolB protein
VSGEGAVVFISSRKRDELFVHSLGDGTTQSLMSHAPFVWAPVVSPDGKEIAFNRNEVDGSWHVWTMPADGRGAPRQLTSGPTGEIHARYTPDGQSIIYHSWGSPRRIWRVPRQGGPPVQLTFGDYEDGYADASPDGQWIAFARTDGAERIHVAPFGGGAARPLTERPSSVPRWSPDGRLIAFSPGRGFNGGIFVIAPDGSGERRLTDVGGWPVWWPDGKQIAYLAVGGEGAQQIWSVPATGGAPRRIGGVRFTGYNYPFDIARDGRHIAGSREVLISREIWLLQPPT